MCIHICIYIYLGHRVDILFLHAVIAARLTLALREWEGVIVVGETRGRGRA